MNKKKPINLELSTISFPLMAIVSILHRISGVALFLLLPLLLYFLQSSLAGDDSFHELQVSLSKISSKFLLWAFLSALSYHLLAGFRHILMDFGLAEDLCSAKLSATVLLVAFVIISIFLGIWLW